MYTGYETRSIAELLRDLMECESPLIRELMKRVEELEAELAHYKTVIRVTTRYVE